MDNKELINKVLISMTRFLSTEQLDKLHSVLDITLHGVVITELQSTEISCLNEDVNEGLLKKFEMDLQVRRLAPGTIYHYIAETFKFLTFINKTCLDITKEDILFYIAMLQSKTYSENTINNVRKYIKAFFTWLVDNDYILKSPFDKISKPKTTVIEKNTLTDMEMENMRDSCVDSRELALIDVLYSTGLRVSEVANIRMDDIDFENRSINVFAKKTRNTRTVYLDSKAIKHIKDYRKDLREEGIENEYLFVNKNKYKNTFNKVSVNAVEKILAVIAERAKISRRITVHVFRKTFASRMFKLGMSPISISRLMGHISFDTTNKFYLAVSNDTVRGEYMRCCA